jgi:hypothetical protein
VVESPPKHKKGEAGVVVVDTNVAGVADADMLPVVALLQ